MSQTLLPIILVPTILVLTIAWQFVLNKSIDYKCGDCGKEFSISPIVGALAPHSMGRKLVTCPGCGKRTWATPVRKD
jgi:DNA-directed RNA polymerase subunit RPC12/RpoP